MKIAAPWAWLPALFVVLMPLTASALPATPLMTLYQYNGSTELPYYAIDKVTERDPGAAAGFLTKGSAVIPCLAMRNGRPLTDAGGTPYVGFELVVDAGRATPADTARFEQAAAQREAVSVKNHHCGEGVRHVVSGKLLARATKPPLFDPPVSEGARPAAGGSVEDAIVRAFHNSSHCQTGNRTLAGRREALERGWETFRRENSGHWPAAALERARNLDYTLRTALFEGHLDRGCNAYGACERNIIALSIRNRARGQCLGFQGCREEGDFQGVASTVSQYNIWDESFTQISGLTSCFLRDDPGLTQGGRADYYTKLRRMYEQSVDDVRRILFGGENELDALFPGSDRGELLSLRHYYHAPAMPKCFGNRSDVEYISAAAAQNGSDFVLLAGTRIQVGAKRGDGYLFKSLLVETEPDRDTVQVVDDYPGFVVDGRKVDLKKSSRCAPYGIPGGCDFEGVGRFRKTPSWLDAGTPLELACRIQQRGASCNADPVVEAVTVGGVCDKEMRPVAGVK